MKSRINHTSYIIDFLDVGFDSDKISQIIKNEVDKKLDSIKLPELNDWELNFNIVYNNVDKLYLFRKSRSYSSEKYKEVVIHLPIPKQTEKSWGVKENQLIKTNFESAKKNSDELEIDYSMFNDRETYIIENFKRAVLESLRLGITINGKRIKIE